MIGSARLLPSFARLYPRVPPDTWFPVLDRHPSGGELEDDRTYVWLQLPGRPRPLYRVHLEVREGSPPDPVGTDPE